MARRRLTRELARDIARRHGIELDKDYHAQGGMLKTDIIEAADEYGFNRRDSHTGRSRGYRFFLYLQRAAGRDE